MSEILARTLWGESRSEGRQGMEAVACVVLNRMKAKRWWGRGVEGYPDHSSEAVCLKPWQFSCWNENDPNREKLLAVTPDDPQYSVALEVAGNALAGIIPDPTDGCTHYKVMGWPWPKNWGLEREQPDIVIGRHEFYKNIK